MINNRNVLQYYVSLRKVDCDVSRINGSYISFIMACTKFPERGMKSLHNLPSIIKYLTNAIDKNYISGIGKVFDIKGLCDDLSKVNKVNLKEFEIGLRMNAMGFDQCMFRYTTSPNVDNINIINLHDPDSIKQINERYFSKVPLDLMSL